MKIPVLLVKEFITPERAEKEAALMDFAHENFPGTMQDGQVNGAESWYGIHWELLEDCAELVSDLTGYELLPAYTYTRLYHKGNSMDPHRDRPSCEFNVSVNLRNVGGTWDFCWYDDEEQEHSVSMEQGDATIYDGHDTTHFRRPCPVENVYQTFLHYVDANGPYAGNANEYLKKRTWQRFSLRDEKAWLDKLNRK